MILIIFLVVAKARERLAVSRKAAQKFDEERFNFSWRLGNSIALRSQTGLKLCRT